MKSAREKELGAVTMPPLSLPDSSARVEGGMAAVTAEMTGERVAAELSGGPLPFRIGEAVAE
jgi:hypothetical protein